jgi:hypothetical protein
VYGFSQDIDWSFLEGSTIEAVSFAAFQIDLHCGTDRIVQLQGTFRLTDGDRVSTGTGQTISTCGELVSLIEDTIASAHLLDARRLSITFQSCKLLELIDDQDAYECFQFRWLGKHTFV